MPKLPGPITVRQIATMTFKFGVLLYQKEFQWIEGTANGRLPRKYISALDAGPVPPG